jgi:excisionase family DNA binding protein
MPEPQERYLSPGDISTRLKVKEGTVRKWLTTGKLKGVKAGRLWRVREVDLETILEGGESKE